MSFKETRGTFQTHQISNIHCTENHIFFFQTSWKDGLSKKIALEYDLSCIIGKDDISFSRKYDLTRWTENERWSFLKNTRKYDIFFRPSENMVFPKGAAPAHDLSCIIWKDGIFFPKTWYFFPGQKVRGGLSQEIHGNMTFLCTRTGVTNVAPRPSVKKIKDGLIPQKYT